MKKIILFVLVLFLITGCKTTQKVDKETEGKILFKNLVKSSESLSDIYVSGMFRLSGVKEIPAAFINFESSGNFKSRNISFKISFLRKPLIQIIVAGEDITFINHSGKQYIRLKYENIDFSKFIGINFNPLEISYFFVGKIPYSSDIQLMSCNFTKNGTRLELTNNDSKYEVILNDNEEITSVKINNQYFDILNLDSIQYTKNDDGESIPKNVNFSNDDGSVKMAFIVDKISFNPKNDISEEEGLLADYTEVFDINEIKVKLK